MKRLFVMLLFACTAGAETLDIRGFITARTGHASGPAAWMEGGFSRFDFSDFATTATGELGLDWNPSPFVAVHLHGLARAEPDSFGGRRAGLVAGFLELHNTSERNRLQLRAGQFFLPTSRENKGDLWSSLYTVTFSAINSWMGQEVRPLGLDFEWRHTTPAFNALTVGATAFGGNDTMGTLLAWRGWSLGHRLPVFDELIPLPPLWSFPVFIPDQNRGGTTPFRSDMDDRVGWAARVRGTLGDRAIVQVTHLDNRGDYELYGDEYSWKTKFTLVGAEVKLSERTVLAGEGIHGFTGMGPYLDFIKGRPVLVGLDSAYVLVSHKIGRHRFSARADTFSLENQDGIGETNEEDGTVLTVAWLYDLTNHLRTALEFSRVRGDSLMAEESGFDPNLSANSVILELRYSFW